MKIFKDIVSGDEMFTDCCPIDVGRSTDVPEALCVVEGKITSEKSGIADSLIGGNKSAEGGCEDEGVDDQGDKKCDIVRNSKLQEMSRMDKQLLKLWAKSFCKAVKEKLTESGEENKSKNFQAKAMEAVLFLCKKINDLDIYSGETMNPKGSLGFLDFKEDGMTPIMYFFKDALIEEKV